MKLHVPRPLWLALATAVLVVVAVGVHFGVPAYRQRVAIEALRHRAGRVVFRKLGPDWLRRTSGSNLMEAVDVVEEVWLNPFDDSVAKSFQSHLFIRNSMPRQRARVDDGMSEIVRLPKLKRLVLVGTDIGDAGMRHVGALTELEELDLWGTSVSDASVDVLAGLQKLKKLYLTDTQMTSDGISRLRDALPKCDIYGLLPAAPDGLESRDLEIERILHGPRSGDTWAP